MNDLISRQMAIDVAMQDVSDKRSHDFNAGATRVANRIKLLPTVEAEPVRHGHWIDEGLYADNFPHHAWRCSKCGWHELEIEEPYGNYCRNCGAKMDEVEP